MSPQEAAHWIISRIQTGYQPGSRERLMTPKQAAALLDLDPQREINDRGNLVVTWLTVQRALVEDLRLYLEALEMAEGGVCDQIEHECTEHHRGMMDEFGEAA